MSEVLPLCSDAWDVTWDLVGRGGFRTVYRACKHNTDDCQYVAKISRLADAEQILYALNEIKVSRALGEA